MFKKLILVLFLIFNFNIITQDYIKNFISDVSVKKDRVLSITENITYVIPYNIKRRGLIREFPTRYRSYFGSNFLVNFKVKEILKDNKPIDFLEEDYYNGKVLKIGNPRVYLSPGQYKYTIRYETNRQLGFFEKWDELFWNVTGQGWRVPILKVKANISLPKSIPTDNIKAKAYTGYFGQKLKDYNLTITKNNIIKVETTQGLASNQGLSVVVKWPKGYIKPPSFFVKAYYFIKDNIGFLILILSSIFLFFFYLYYYFSKIRSLKEKFTVIPLFYPPDNLSPGETGYISNKDFNSKLLASDIVNLAVMGFLKINQGESNKYILERTDKDIEKISENYSYYIRILKSLFKKANKITIGAKYQPDVNLALLNSQSFLFYNFSKYFDSHKFILIIGSLFSFVSFLFSQFISSFNINLTFLIMSPLFIASIILLLAVNLLFIKLFYSYTKDGFELLSKINGFKLFLKTTETERLKVIYTPTIETPKLYEEYLPYAMVLGVEKAWSQKFVPVFEKLKNQGIQYQPSWFTGISPFNPYKFNLISYSFSQSLNSSSTIISSSNIAPGSRSGWSGGGAGRGGGGGGGGGW